jgi:hypothetical protein
MNPVEDMIQAYVAFADGAITKEEYHVHYAAFCKYCNSCDSKNIAALFEDQRFQEATIKLRGEELGRQLIKSGLNCGKHVSKCVCGKGDDDAADNSGEY